MTEAARAKREYAERFGRSMRPIGSPGPLKIREDRVVCGLAVPSDPTPVGCPQRSFQSQRVKVVRVRRGARLLPPRLVKAAHVHGVESESLDEAHRFRSSGRRIARHGQRNASGRTFGSAILEQALEADVVEHLDYGSSELLSHPRAFDLSPLDGADAAITRRVVVAGVDDDDVIWDAGKIDSSASPSRPAPGS